MKTLLRATPLLLLAAIGCGRQTPPAAGQAEKPAFQPSSAPAGAPAPASEAPSPAAEAGAVTLTPIRPVIPPPAQQAKITAAAQELTAALAAAQVRATRHGKDEYAAQKAAYDKQVALGKSEAAARQKEIQDRWLKDKAVYEAVLADPKASPADKQLARIALNAGAGKMAIEPTPVPAFVPIPIAPSNGDPKATQALDELICQFRQAVQFHDHDRALALMRQTAALSANASPSLVEMHLAEVKRYLASFTPKASGDTQPPAGPLPAN